MKKVPLGHVTHVRLNLTDPIVSDYDMDVGQIMILVGQNGVGKTLVMKVIWCMTTLASHALLVRHHKLPFNPVQQLQYIFDNSFDDQNFDGNIHMDFGSSGSSIEAVFEHGKVLDVKYDFPEEVETSGAPIFMSKDTRLMSDFVKYLKTKKLFALPTGMPTNEKDMAQLLEYYKLYDIVYMEQFLHRVEHKTTPDVIKKFNQEFSNFDEKFSLQAIRIDYSKPDILYTDDKGVEKSTLTLGAGHQSLFGMILFQIY